MSRTVQEKCRGVNMRGAFLLLFFLPGYLLQTILLATKTGVDQVIVTGGGSIVLSVVNFVPNGPPLTGQQLENVLHGVYAVDVYNDRAEIYAISGRKLLRVQYHNVTGNLLGVTEVGSANFLLTDLAVDWETNAVYFSCTRTNQIVEANLTTSTPNAIGQSSRNVSSIEIDPYTRRIFYIDESKRVMQYELGEPLVDDVMVRSGFPLDITEVLEIAIDIPKETLYTIVTYMDGGTTTHRCLIRIDYKTFEYKIVYEGAELTNIVGLDAFNDEVFWANHHNLTYKLYKGQVSLEGVLENVTPIHETTYQEIRDIKIYNRNSQKPSILNLCSKKKCSHGCMRGNKSKYPHGVVCTCPKDMLLGADGRTCTGSLLETFLLATDTGIEEVIVTDNGSTTSTVVNLTQGASALYFHRAKNEIYIISEKGIHRASYNPPMKTPSAPTQVPSTCKTITDLAFDWVKSNIFYSCTNQSVIKKIHLSSSKLIEYSAPLNDVGSYVGIDPYARRLFCILDRKRLIQYGTDEPLSTDVMVRSGFPYEITEMYQVAVDVPKQTVYVLIKYVDGGTTYDWCLIRIDYKIFYFKIVDTGQHMSNVVSLDVFNEKMVWCTKHNLLHTLYRASISSNGQLENITVIYKTEQKRTYYKEIRDVKIYHRDAQTPSMLNLCLMNNCSHDCKRVSNMTSPDVVDCICPTGMSLKDDRRTCKVIPRGKDFPLPASTMKTPPSRQVEEKEPITDMGSYASIVLPVMCVVALVASYVYYKRYYTKEGIKVTILGRIQ